MVLREQGRITIDRIRQIPEGIKTLDQIQQAVQAEPRDPRPTSSARAIPVEVISIRRLTPDALRALKGDIRYLGQPRIS